MKDQILSPVGCRCLWTSTTQRRRSTRCLYRENLASQRWAAHSRTVGMLLDALTAPSWMRCRKVSQIHTGNLCLGFVTTFRPATVTVAAAPISFHCKRTARASLGWRPISRFDFSPPVSELQPRPRPRPQAHHDRWVGCVGEAQRRPDHHQETHRENGGGEFPSIYASSSLSANCNLWGPMWHLQKPKGELSVVILSTTILTWWLQLKRFGLLAKWQAIFHHNYRGWEGTSLWFPPWNWKSRRFPVGYKSF